MTQPKKDLTPKEAERIKRDGDDVGMMTYPELWPLRPVLPLVNRDRNLADPDSHGFMLDMGPLRTTVFIGNIGMLTMLGSAPEVADLSKMEREKYESFQQAYDAGWRVD